jgi:hypothetical protein
VYTLIAHAASGRSTVDSSPISVTLTPDDVEEQVVSSGSPVETTLLNIEFSSPSMGASVSGTVPLIVTIQPTASRVVFDVYHVDGRGLPEHLTATKNDNTWVADWDTTNEPNGTYTVQPTALNERGVAILGPFLRLDVLNTSSSEAARELDATQAVSTTKEVKATLPTITYDAISEMRQTKSIDEDLGLSPQDMNRACVAGSLIKIKNDLAVYYCGADGQRYAFPNARVFFSWFSDFSNVREVSLRAIGGTPLAGSVRYRPGARLIKIQTDPRVYAISKGGILHWVTSEAIAKQLYGEHWNQQVDDVSDADFGSYTVGEPIK